MSTLYLIVLCLLPSPLFPQHSSDPGLLSEQEHPFRRGARDPSLGCMPSSSKHFALGDAK